MVGGDHLWSAVGSSDLNFDFLESFVNKMVYKGAKRYDPSQRIDELGDVGSVSGSEDGLIVNYTKVQIESSLKKQVLEEEGDTRIRIRGRNHRKWGIGNDSVNSVVGVEALRDSKSGGSGKFDGFGNAPVPKSESTWLSSTVSKIGQSVFQKERSDKRQTSNWVKAPRTVGESEVKISSKKTVRRQNIANALFSQSDDLFIKPSTVAKNSATGTGDLVKVKTVERAVMDLDLLGDSTTRKGDSIMRRKEMSVETFESLWVRMESREHSFNVSNVSDLVSLKTLALKSGFGVVEVLESEFIACSELEGETVLLFGKIDNDSNCKIRCEPRLFSLVESHLRNNS